MKKIIIFMSLLLLSIFLSSCGLETAKEHKSRIQAEKESIEELQKDTESNTTQVTEAESDNSISANSNTSNSNNTTGKNSTTPSAASSNNNTANDANQGVNSSPAAPAPEQPAVQTVTVYLTVKCNKVLNNSDLNTGATIPSDGIMLKNKEITVPKGSTVYTVMSYAQSLGYLTFTTPDNGYLSSINGLSEYECGSESGWKYMVDSYICGVSANVKTVKNGSKIVWFYALTAGDTDK